MKTLSKLEIMTITNAAKRNNASPEEIKTKLADRTKKINEPKKTTFWDSYDDSSENGMI